MDPYEWVDLEECSYAADPTLFPQKGSMSGDSSALILDSFHQTLFSPQVNQKERLQAEDVFLVESEWTRLIESYPDDLICILSQAGNFRRVSENCKKLTGQRPDQLIDINIVNFIHINELPSFYDQLNQVVNGGKTCRLAHQFRSGENWLEFDSTFYPIFTKLMGDYRCVIMHARLLGGANEVVEKTQVQLSRKFISRLTMDGIYTYISPPVTKILGFTPQEFLGHSVFEFFNPDLAAVKATKNEQLPMIHKLKRKDGKETTVETLFNVFRNPVSNAPECILCTTTELQQDDSVDLENSGIIELLQKEVDDLKKLLEEKNLELEELKAESQERNEGSEKKKRKRKLRTDLQCEECGTRESPEWRKGPSGIQSLCNACGLRFSKKVRAKGDLGVEASSTEKMQILQHDSFWPSPLELESSSSQIDGIHFDLGDRPPPIPQGDFLEGFLGFEQFR